MKIIRDGIPFELTEEEMITAAEELYKMRKAKEEAEYEERCRRSREWVAFRKGDAKVLPYPQNLLFCALFDWREGDIFFEGSEEHRKDIIKGLLWAIDTLPDENRRAIEYWYRDKMKLREGGELLNCTASRFSQIRDNGIRQLRSVKRYKAYRYGYSHITEGMGA